MLLAPRVERRVVEVPVPQARSGGSWVSCLFHFIFSGVGSEEGGGKRDLPRQRFPRMSPSALVMLEASGSTAGRTLMLLYFVPMASYWVVWVLDDMLEVCLRLFQSMGIAWDFEVVV
jgi:hypothetical protein